MTALDSCPLRPARDRAPARLRRAVTRALAPGLAVVLAGAALPAAAKEGPPVYVDVQLDGSGWTGENCEGGEWGLTWNGAVAVEPGPLGDLLNSYTAFDTTQPNQGELRPAKFDAKPVTCRDNHGNVVLRGNVARSGSSQVQMTVSLAENAAQNSPFVAFTADELGTCRVQGAGMSMEQPVMVGINTAQLNTIDPPIQLTMEDLERGFDTSYRFDGTVIGAAPMCMGAQLRRGTLRMRYKSGEEDPTVAFDACLHLAKDEVRSLAAHGSPAGGTYTWSARGDAIAVRGLGGNTAEARGQTPGRGGVNVSYSRNGRSADVTVAGSVVEVVSINGGAAIPKIGIYGANGMQRTGTYDYPLKLAPADGMVTMTVENEALASVVNTSSRVQVQPVRVGETTMQAKTLCGTPLGPRVPIVIVRCDDDVKAQLKTQQAQLKAQVDQLVKRITQLTANAEFQEAATEIAGSTRDLALKTGESIIGTLSYHDGQRMAMATKNGIALTKEMTVNANRIMAVSTVYDLGDLMNDGGESIGSDDWMTIAKPFIGGVIKLSGSEALGLVKTYTEAYLAARKFGRQLGTLAGVVEQLENLEPQLDHAIREYVRISTRLEYCEQGGGTTKPPKPEPKPDPKPAPTPEPIPVEIEEPVEIPVPEEPVPPPPPPTPPSEPPGKAVVGLACRIQDLRAPGVAQRLSALRQHVLATRTSPPPAGTKESAAALEGITNATIDTALARHAELQTLTGFGRDMRALETFARTQQQNIEAAQADLQQWQGAIERLRVASETTQAQAVAEFGRFRQSFDTFVLSGAKRSDASLDTMMETDDCRDRLQVKIDQVRVRYN